MKDAWKVMAGVVATVGLGIFLGSSVNVHGNIINADTGYQLGASAPVGHTLVGNGTYYVDSGPSTQLDEYWSFSGCSIINVYNSAGGCTATENLPIAMADSNYFVICSANGISSGTTYTAGTSISPSPYSSSQISYVAMQIYSGGSPPVYSFTVACHAHHS
jgi:hypothetical protein